MPLYEIQQLDLTLREIAPSTFSDLKIHERGHLQAMLRDTPGVIGPDLFVFAEEFSDWQESLRRVDLLALDKEANLVIIELKRVEEGGHMELQALRYAAMLSTVDFDGVVEAYEKMLANPNIADKRGHGPGQAREALLEFLSATDDVVISDTPESS
jgi:RecB family endonuclease NucS